MEEAADSKSKVTQKRGEEKLGKQGFQDGAEEPIEQSHKTVRKTNEKLLEAFKNTTAATTMENILKYFPGTKSALADA